MADADDHEKDVWKTSVDIPACRSLSSTEGPRALRPAPQASEVCGLLGLERITLIVLGHRGKYAGCLSRPEYRLDAANAAKNPGV